MAIRVLPAIVAVAASTALCVATLPHGWYSVAIFSAEHDPVALTQVQLDHTLRTQPNRLAVEIEAALAAGDTDLASSFIDLATDRGSVLPDGLRERVAARIAEENSTTEVARRVATGFITGKVEDGASLAGTVAGDLMVYGDIRDLVREGHNLLSGEEADHLIMGLATVGIAMTAATFVSAGGAAPARAGLTLIKDARKLGRIGEGITSWAGRSVRHVVDGPAMREAVSNASVLRPSQTVAAIKGAVRGERAGELVSFAKNVSRVGSKAGTRGAMDVLRVADSPREVARAARLAEAHGSRTRAILKLFGRGALVLAAGAFQLAGWLLWASLALLGLLSSIKAVTERLTWRWLQYKKARASQDLKLSAG